MKNSVFRSLIEEKVKTDGFEVLLSEEFSSLIKKTVILKKVRDKAVFTWVDKNDAVMMEHNEDHYSQSTLPRIGKVEIIDPRAEYRKQYDKNRRTYHLSLTKHDQDIIEKLNSCDNIQGYIKQLIRDDIKKSVSEM